MWCLQCSGWRFWWRWIICLLSCHVSLNAPPMLQQLHLLFLYQGTLQETWKCCTNMNELELSATVRPIHRHELLHLIGFTAMVPGVPAVSPSQTATAALPFTESILPSWLSFKLRSTLFWRQWSTSECPSFKCQNQQSKSLAPTLIPLLFTSCQHGLERATLMSFLFST
jgi:hypothetical protein